VGKPGVRVSPRSCRPAVFPISAVGPKARRRLLPALLLLIAALPAASLPPEDAPRRAVGAVPGELREARSLGPAPADLPLERVVVALAPRDPAGLARLLEDQHDPASPLYRRWLSPAEFGARFGPTDAEIAALAAWLTEQGLGVESAAAGRLALVVSGRVADVERAFATRIEEVVYRGELHRANVVAPSVPARLARTIAGVLSLNDFRRKRPLSHAISSAGAPDPLYNSGGSHKLAPADFTRIYGADPLLASGVDGRGVTIAIVGRTNVSLDDAKFFRQYFGLAANDPTLVLNGEDPGMVSSDEVLEADLDIEWSGGVAPKAAVKLVVSKSTVATDGIDLSSLYVVDHDAADVVSVSFGQCERDFDAGNLAFYANLWAQAAAQGISVVVASGDSGAAGCDDASASSGTVLGVNGLSTPPYATCVGGSQLDDAGGSTFWDTANDPTTKRSALAYIPEVVWNESGLAGGQKLYATGGGLSGSFARAAWQRVAGLDAGAMRAVPDVSVNAAGHSAYLIVRGHSDSSSGLLAVLGTSASAPAFAGLVALLVQHAGGRLGSLNPSLYALGAAQYSGAGPAVFHDVRSGNNSVPGLIGYSARPGYDLATGLGTPDTSALAAAWPPAAPSVLDLALGATPAIVSLSPGGSATTSITLDSGSGLAASVTASAPSGLTVRFAPGRESSGHDVGYVSSGSPADATIAAAPDLAAGSYTVDFSVTLAGTTRRLKVVAAVGGAAPALGDAVELHVPVVLDVFGAASSHYTSDLVVVNRSATDATLHLRYVAAPGTSGAGGQAIARSLPAGRELYLPDVIAFLRANGIALADDKSQKIGTLFATFAGVADASLVFAGSRTTTPNADASVGGAYGTFAAATRSGSATGGEAWVYGLRQDAAYRSNLAVVHSPGGASSATSAGPISIEVRVFDGMTGQSAGDAITFSLQPGEFHQVNEILSVARAGLSNGYARVKRTSGTDRFIAYGVVNDGGSSGSGTSDGSFIVSGGSDGLVPIVLDLPGSTHYRTELTLTSTSASPSVVTLRYTPSTVFGDAKGGGLVTTTLAPGAQLVTTNAIGFLRGLGLEIPDDGTKQGGTLLVTGVVALARTFNPNPNASIGGTYGLAYPAIGASERAKSSAVVFGLRRDDSVRSNLAIADARVGDATAVDYAIDVYDAVSGSSQPVQTLTRTLVGGQWTQVDSILAASGVTHGWVRVRVVTGTSDFVVYGVVNDGAQVGSRTSDGSYLPMFVEQ
jgi:pseudomonalisin